MGSESVLQLDYLSRVELAERPVAWWRNVLGIASFDATGPSPGSTDVPFINVQTPVLGGNVERYEVWRGANGAQTGTRGRIQYRRDGGLVFGRLSIAEGDFGGASAQSSALQRATETAYREIFELIDELSMPHLVRVWNFLPDINGESHGSERYWQFNSARQDGFMARGRDLTGSVPAACGVGSARGTPLAIYFLASDTAPTAVENPRQISAYHYPPEYSPRSPTFSRACVAEFSDGRMLFVSGTASILGHETVHVGDAAAQTRESLRNIEAVLRVANERARAASALTMSDLWYKIYVRHAADQALVDRELRSVLGPAARALYLHAELCRRELLVEIEASGCSNSSA
jgi:chorismate lyase / 3-hydroxybenzoate synthase